MINVQWFMALTQNSINTRSTYTAAVTPSSYSYGQGCCFSPEELTGYVNHELYSHRMFPCWPSARYRIHVYTIELKMDYLPLIHRLHKMFSGTASAPTRYPAINTPSRWNQWELCRDILNTPIVRKIQQAPENHRNPYLHPFHISPVKTHPAQQYAGTASLE